MSKVNNNNKEAILKTSFTELHKFAQNNQYDKALKSANRILGIASDDEKALHCKVICLIHLSRFSEAIQLLTKNNLNHLVFERAYCEYRLNQPEKALETIDSSGIPQPLPLNLSELRAQILYKLEKYDECYDIYKNILKNTHDDYDQERKANLTAVASNLPDKREDPSVFSEETYELCFNSACALLQSKKFNEAEKKLRLCEKICRESLEEDGASKEEIEEEIALIKIQLAYCLQMQGNIKEASAIYLNFLKTKSKDTTLVAVASNNSVAINKDQNVFDSKKKMRYALAEVNEHKLTFKQKKQILINNCILALFANSIAQCKELCDKLVKTYPNVEFEATLIKCACLCKDKKYDEAIKMLEKFGSGKNSTESKFAICQMHLLNNNRKAAIDTLLSLGDIKYKPGVVSALVTLYLSLDNRDSASNVLKSAVEWYKINNVNSEHLSDMWRYAADFHLRGNETEIAAKSLEELYKLNPKDMKTLAQLVIAYAQFDTKKAQEVSKKLPPLETLTTPAEIDALEATNWIMAAKAVRKTTKLEQSPGVPTNDGQKVKIKTRRKRKGKLPKNYNPDVPPDPERWLPKYERSTYKRKRDRRTKEVIKGSQGTASHSADQYDMSKNISKSSPMSPSQESTPAPAPTPRTQHRKGPQKKKKGRH